MPRHANRLARPGQVLVAQEGFIPAEGRREPIPDHRAPRRGEVVGPGAHRRREIGTVVGTEPLHLPDDLLDVPPRRGIATAQAFTEN